MADALSAEEEARERVMTALSSDWARVWATIDAARAERDQSRRQRGEAARKCEALIAQREQMPELAALRALADAVEADGTLDKTREYLRRHGPIVADYAPHLRPIPLALAAVSQLHT